MKMTGALAAAISLLLSAGAPAFALNQDDPSRIDWSQVESGNCLVPKDKWGFKACRKGDPTGYWNVAFVGDSHMRQYFAPLDILAFRYHWKVTYISKSACTVANHKLYPIKRYKDFSCRSWNKSLEKHFASKKPYDLVVNSNSAFDSHANVDMAHAFKATVLSQTRRGTQWLVLSDTPKPQEHFQSCINGAGQRAERVCRLPYSKAMKPVDLLPRTVHAIPGVKVADFKNVYCPAECPAVIGGVQVYRDYSHITSDFAKTMLPYLDAVVPGKFKKPPRPKP